MSILILGIFSVVIFYGFTGVEAQNPLTFMPLCDIIRLWGGNFITQIS